MISFVSFWIEFLKLRLKATFPRSIFSIFFGSLTVKIFDFFRSTGLLSRRCLLFSHRGR